VELEQKKMRQLTNDNLTDQRRPQTALTIQPLGNENKAETLDFLSGRPPQQTFIMAGWIHDNGLVSPLNRGSFFGYRNTRGQLEGVALVGHATLFETQEDAALAAFATLTQSCPSCTTLLGEQEKMSRFLNYYTAGRPAPSLVCQEMMFEQKSKQQLDDSVSGLCLATPSELDLVVPVHAQMALEETGSNPLDVDPTGFRQRCARRIDQKRVWVRVEDNRLTFKADVICALPEIAYLEGVYVSPEKRGNGFGARCVRQLTNTLLTHSKSVCLLVKEQNLAAQACYLKAGYTLRSESYQTLFLNQNN
jgi:ribosomal protein S18 acetylase RimI-like enzyme